MAYTASFPLDILDPARIYAALGVLSISAVLYRLFLKPILLSPLRNVPGPSFGHPIYGQFKNVLMAEAGALNCRWAEKYGPVVRTIGPLGVERVMFLTPNALRRILISDWTNYPRPEYMRNLIGINAGYGLFTVTGNEHKQMRHALNPAFSLPNLMSQTEMYYPPLESLLDVLYQKTQAQTHPSTGLEVKIHDWIIKLTLNIICQTAFGYGSASVDNPNHELASTYSKLFKLQNSDNYSRIITLLTLPGFPRLLRSDFAYRNRRWLFRGSFLAPAHLLVSEMHHLKTISRQIIAEKRADIDVSDAESKRDLMTILVRMNEKQEEDGHKMSDQDLVNHMLTFLIAGHETTASGISWTLWLLANSLEVQDRLRAEVTPIIEKNARPDYRTLKELQWLDNVVMESLRLYPPVPLVTRKVVEGDWVEGVYLPKGTMVSIAIRAVNTWTQIWGPDAMEFHPERWLNLPSTYDSSFSLLTFNTGPHGCIGRAAAIMEIKAVIAVLIAHFSFEPAYDGQVSKSTSTLFLRPADNLPLKIKPIGKLPKPSEII